MENRKLMKPYKSPPDHLGLTLSRGCVVKAIIDIDPGICPVPKGTLGVVFEDYDAYGDGSGPMVRWVNGYACNVYDGWCERMWPKDLRT